MPVYPAFFAVLAFHMIAGLFQSVKPEHEANYARGSHAIFHLEKQGMLVTRRGQLLWVLAAVVVCFLQAYINKVILDQCLVWVSEISPRMTSDEIRSPLFWKPYG